MGDIYNNIQQIPQQEQALKEQTKTSLIQLQKVYEIVPPSGSVKKISLDPEKQQIIKTQQLIIFISAYLAYASIHSTRTAWSSSKQSLKEDMDEHDNHFVAWVDTCFLLSYAISMKIFGIYSNKFQIQYSLGFGMVSSSICFLVIYFICEISISKGFILFMMILNGISQSTGWPCVVASMGNWYGSGKKGIVMGILGTSGNFGNMIGYFIQGIVVNELDLNWKFVFFVIGIFLLIIGSYIAFNIEAYPGKLGITKDDLDSYEKLSKKEGESNKYGHFRFIDEDNNRQEDDFQKRNETIHLEQPLGEEIIPKNDNEITPNEGLEQPVLDNLKNDVSSTTKSSISDPLDKKDQASDQEVNQLEIQFDKNQENLRSHEVALHQIEAQTTANDPADQEINKIPPEDDINLFNAWVRVPGLAIYAFTMGGVKGTVYGLLLWMPIYLQEKGLKSEAPFICSMNEIGTFAGGILLGMLIDKFKMKATSIVASLAISSLIMFIIHILPAGKAAPYFLFVLLGGISLGGPYILLGGAIAIDLAQQPQLSNKKNITALIAGIIEGFGSFVAAFVQIIVPQFGQEYIFVLFGSSCFCSCLFLLSQAIKEVKEYLQQ